jgi:hypothetical protein
MSEVGAGMGGGAPRARGRAPALAAHEGCRRRGPSRARRRPGAAPRRPRAAPPCPRRRPAARAPARRPRRASRPTHLPTRPAPPPPHPPPKLPQIKKRKDINTIMIIGAGPIVIGQVRIPAPRRPPGAHAPRSSALAPRCAARRAAASHACRRKPIGTPARPSRRPASLTTPAPRPASRCARRATVWCCSTPTRWAPAKGGAMAPDPGPGPRLRRAQPRGACMLCLPGSMRPARAPHVANACGERRAGVPTLTPPSLHPPSEPPGHHHDRPRHGGPHLRRPHDPGAGGADPGQGGWGGRGPGTGCGRGQTRGATRTRPRRDRRARGVAARRRLRRGSRARPRLRPVFPPLQERPDAILPTMGGQTGLNLAKNLAEVRWLHPGVPRPRAWCLGPPCGGRLPGASGLHSASAINPFTQCRPHPHPTPHSPACWTSTAWS